jgi:uncharacterized protein (TIGR02145 family)
MGQANIVYAGEESMLGVEPIAGATYQWDLYADNTTINFATVPGNCPVTDAFFVAGNTSPTVTVKWVNPGIYYFRVIVQEPSGCMNLKLGRMEVTTTMPEATWVIPPPVCIGQSTNLQIQLSGFPPWSLTYTENGNPFTINNINTSPLLIPVTPVSTTTYYITSVTDGNGNTNTNQVGPAILEVLPTPAVTFAPCFNSPTTPEASPFKLRGGFPLGGTYSGAGVNSTTGIFTPGALAPGTYPVTYSYTNSYNCSAEAQQPIEVLPAPAFTCGDSWVDIRDNKSYPTVLINGQCWFAANLDHGISIQSTVPQSDNCEREKYCYNNDPANCTQYGGLYQWDELMSYDAATSSQGICPPGWHIPAESEWQTLMQTFGGAAFAGWPLRDPANPGFNALMGGVLYQNNTFSHRNLATLFWTSTPVTPVKIISHGMNNKDQSVSYYESLRNNAFPVRCVR